MSRTRAVIALDSRHVVQTYRRVPVVMVRGRGSRVWDADGRRYLDFVGGIATAPLGHGDPALARAIAVQAARLIGVSNLYYMAPQAELARRLARRVGFPVRVFFSNSGAEAVETAIKLARKATGRAEIVAAEHGFHGRTYGALSATWKPAFRRPFRPLVPGFRHVPYGDARALARAVTRRTAAFLVEPIQGEAGVQVPPNGYLRQAARICRARGALLVCDEVQSGLGRTGRFFAFQEDGVRPDIVTMAKGLGGGVPIGATIARAAVARALAPGDHGSTFGGNCVSCAAALAVLDAIERRGLMRNAARMGGRLQRGLRAIGRRTGVVIAVRGRGLIVGADLAIDAKAVVNAALRRGLLVNATSEKTLRFLPPLTVTAAEVDETVRILADAIGEVRGRP